MSLSGVKQAASCWRAPLRLILLPATSAGKSHSVREVADGLLKSEVDFQELFCTVLFRAVTSLERV